MVANDSESFLFRKLFMEIQLSEIGKNKERQDALNLYNNFAKKRKRQKV